jgi:hypothetical protein
VSDDPTPVHGTPLTDEDLIAAAGRLDRATDRLGHEVEAVRALKAHAKSVAATVGDAALRLAVLAAEKALEAALTSALKG